MSSPNPDYLSPDNLGKLRLVDPPTPRRGQSPRTRITGQFLRGPIPMAWLERAARLPGKALAVALAIRFEAGRQGDTRPIKLTNPLVTRLGVSRKAKYAALTALEGAGLIQVSRQPRKSPLVTVVGP